MKGQNLNKKIIFVRNFDFNIPSMITKLISNKKDFYINYTEDISSSKKFIDKYNVIDINKIYKKEFNKNIFINDFLDLFNNIKTNNDQLFTFSEMATRNPFTSKLPELIFQYYTTIKIIEDYDFNTLLIINNNNYFNLCILQRYKNNSFINFINLDKFFYLKIYTDNFFKIIKIRMYKDLLSILYKKFVSNYYLKNIKKDIINKKYDYLVKTHVFKSSFNKNLDYEDKFFVNLAKFINHKYKTLFVAHLHNDYVPLIKTIHKSSLNNIVPNELFISFNKVIISFTKIYLNNFKIYECYFRDVEISKLITYELRRSGLSLSHYLHYDIYDVLLKKIKVSNIFMTFENISWEKRMIQSIRKLSPSTFIYGFQHSVVFPAASGIFLTKKEVKENLFPDEILTVGDVPLKIIKNYSKIPITRIKSFCAIRYDHIFNKKIIPRNNNKTLLVLLEGVPNVIRMLVYLFKSINDLKKYKIIIRCHPILDWHSINKYLKLNINKINNLTISQSTNILEDINKSSVCMYWSSATALEALSLGKPLIAFDMKTPLQYDPLFDCNDFKWKVDEETSLKDKLDEIHGMDDKDYYFKLQSAKNYLNNYFRQANEKIFLEILK